MTFVIHFTIFLILLAVQETKGQGILYNPDKNECLTKTDGHLENKILSIARELLLSHVMLFRREFESDINNLQRNVHILHLKVEKIYDTTKSPFQRLDVSRSIHETMLQRVEKLEHDETILTQRVDKIENNTRDRNIFFLTNHRTIQSEMGEIKNNMATLNSTSVSHVHVSELSTKIESLASQVHSVEKNITNIEIHIEALMMAQNKYAENMTSEIKKLKNTTTTGQEALEQQIFEVQDTLTHQISKIIQNASSIGKQIEGTVQSNNLQISNLTVFKTELDALSNNMSIFKEITNLCMTDIHKLAKDMSVVEDIVHGQNSSLKILSTDTDNLTSNVSSLIISNIKQASDIGTLMLNISVVHNTITTLMESSNDRNFTLSKLQLWYDSCASEIRGLLSNLSLTNDRLHRADEKIAAQNLSIKRLKSDQDSCKLDVNGLISNVTLLHNELIYIVNSSKEDIGELAKDMRSVEDIIHRHNSTFRILSNHIDNLMSNVSTLITSNTKQASDIGTLLSNISVVENTITTMIESSNTRNLALAKLQIGYDSCASDIRDLSSNLSLTNDRLYRVDDKLTAQNITMKRLKAEQDSCQLDVNGLISNVTLLHNELVYIVNSSKEDIGELAKDMRSVEDIIHKHNSTFRILSNHIDNLTSNVSTLITSNTKQASDIGTLLSNISVVENTITTMIESSNTRNLALAKLQIGYDSCASDIRDLSSNLSLTNDRLYRVDDKLTAQNITMKRLKAEQDSCQLDVNGLISNMTILQNELVYIVNSSTEDIDKLAKYIIYRHNSTFKILSTRIDYLTSNISTLITYNTKQASDIGTLMSNISVVQNTVTTVMESSNSRDLTLAKLQLRYDSCASDIRDLTSNLSLINDRLYRVGDKLNAQNITIKRLQIGQDSCQLDVNGLISNMTFLHHELVSIVNSSKGHIGELAKDLFTVENIIYGHNSTFMILSNHIDYLKSNISTLVTSSTKQAFDIGTLTSNISTLMTSNTMQASDIGTLTSKISNLMTSSTKQAFDIGTLTSNISTLMTSNTKQASGIGTLTSKISKLMASNTKQASDIGTLTSKISKLMASNTKQASDIGTLTSKVSNLMTSNTKQASDIGTLTSNISILITSKTKQAFDIGTLMSNMSVVENTITTVIKTINSRDLTLAKLQNEQLVFNTSLHEILSNLSSIQKIIIVLEKSKTIQNSQIESVRSGQANCTADMYSLMSKISITKDSIILLQDAQRQGNFSLNLIKAKYGSLTKQILYNISIMNNILEDLVRKQNATLTVVEEKQQLCSASINVINSSMENMEKTINRRFEKVNSSNSDRLKELHTLRSVIEHQNVTILDIHSKQMVLWMNFSELDQEKRDLKSEVIAIQHYLNNTLSVVKNQALDILTIQQNQNTTQKDMETLHMTITSTKNEISSVQSRVNAAININSQQSTKIQTIQRKQNTIEADLRRLRGTVTSTGSRVTSVQSRLNGAISVNSDQTRKIQSIQQKQTALQKSIPPMQIRLRGGGTRYGRVEVQVMGQWGTICDDGWGSNDARVVCRMLGRYGGTAYGEAKYGQGSGIIWMDDVACTGSETSLLGCRHNGFGTHNCQHSEDASVYCS